MLFAAVADTDPASILGVNHETRTGLVQALWSYVKINQLQDKIDRRMVRADDALRPVGTFFLHLGDWLIISRSSETTQFRSSN
jgi:hypothetical protein